MAVPSIRRPSPRTSAPSHDRSRELSLVRVRLQARRTRPDRCGVPNRPRIVSVRRAIESGGWGNVATRIEADGSGPALARRRSRVVRRVSDREWREVSRSVDGRVATASPGPPRACVDSRRDSRRGDPNCRSTRDDGVDTVRSRRGGRLLDQVLSDRFCWRRGSRVSGSDSGSAVDENGRPFPYALVRGTAPLIEPDTLAGEVGR